ncbi:MAG: inorganic phosphate transporter [Candidatus Thorarchaeota archaeon]|nr:inorganic phosphate transporter [Candidatus Thorarchaeota archaeon]
MDPLLLGILFIISFLVAFAIGGNDEAMAPAVGARVFTVRAAVIIGAIITVVGALSLGGNVSEKVGSDLVGGGTEPMTLTIDMVFAILISMIIWLLLASITKGLPISTTQCIVGSVMGVAIFAPFLGYSEWGVDVIDWYVVFEIFLGWILSPVIGFLFAAAVFALVRKIQKRAKGFSDFERQEKIASYLLAGFLILTSLSRGGNDVANAIAPLTVLPDFIGTYDLGFIVIPRYIIPLLVGGTGMALGLIVVGRKVIKTLATEVVTLSPSSALAASVSVSMIIFVGTLLGLPLSGTHVLVAALIAVGWVSETPVQMKQVKDILVSWVVTVPVSALFAIAVFWAIQGFF